jgi:hypothetical protein
MKVKFKFKAELTDRELEFFDRLDLELDETYARKVGQEITDWYGNL